MWLVFPRAGSRSMFDNQDLYFLDSGSKKIMKLSTSIGDPSQNPAAMMITFAGHGLPAGANALDSFFV